MTGRDDNFRRSRHEKYADMIVGVVMSAGAASIALIPLLGIGFALVIGSPSGLGSAVLGVIGLPISFCAYLVGAVMFGPLSYLVLERLRICNEASAALSATLFSGLFAWLLFGRGVPDNSLDLVVPIALAGGVGGLVFWKQMNRSPKPPPAPTS